MSDLLHNGASSNGQRRIGAEHATEAISTSRRPVPRKAYVRIDMEGVSGVVSTEQVRPGSAEYEYARRMLMHDLKAVLDGIFAAGCQEAIVYDAHLSGRNIDLDTVDGRAVVISGRPELLNGYFYGQDLSVAPLFLVGCHARAGTPQALLPRTYADDIADLRINGAVMGETGMEAALAGEHGVPLVFVSGDSAAIGEARELLGSDVQTVEVKTAISSDGGICLPAARTGKMLREAAIRAVRYAAAAPPLVFQTPVTLDVRFTCPESARALEGMEGIERMGEMIVRTRGQSVVAAYRAFATARMKAAQLPSAACAEPPPAAPVEEAAPET